MNSRPHAKVCAVPDERLCAERALLGPLPSLRPNFGRVATRKVDRLSCARFGSARYSVPTKLIGRQVELQAIGGEVPVLHFGEVVAAHALVAPAEASVKDEHYGGARKAPQRKPRPRSEAEKAICELGEVGEAYIKGAAAAGVTKLASELEDLVGLAAAHGREALVAAMAAARLRAANFPVKKTLSEFDFSASSIPRQTLDYLSSLEWVSAKEGPCLVGPPGTGKSHVLVALGHAAVEAGYKVRYFAASELVDALYRGLADNSVGRFVEPILRADVVIVDEVGFAPLDDTGAQLLFRFVAAAYERRSVAIASHWPFEQWGRFLPNETTAVSLLDSLLHHAIVVVTDGESFRMREARQRGGPSRPKAS